MSESYGWNDDKNNVFCGFCAWTEFCPAGMEQIEFRLLKHLSEVHKKTALYRIDDQGKWREIAR